MGFHGQLILATLWKPIFRTTLGQSDCRSPISQHFILFTEKRLLDNTIFIRYLNLGRLKSAEACFKLPEKDKN